MLPLVVVLELTSYSPIPNRPLGAEVVKTLKLISARPNYMCVFEASNAPTRDPEQNEKEQPQNDALHLVGG